MTVKAVQCRQYLKTDILVLEIDGSAVTTNDADNAGLTEGSFAATVKKGAGADSNLVTITLNKPLGRVPQVFYQEKTLDCICRDDVAPTKSVIKVRTLELDGTTQEDDADFRVLIIGTREVREGDYG